MTIDNHPITPQTWQSLVQANQRAVAEGWAEPGVFAPGIGPEYRPGAAHSILYVGKNAGPLGAKVGSGFDQAASISASTQWMVQFRNRSPFWQFIDKLDPTRRRIAWTNVCKIDRRGGDRPPNGSQWREIAEVSIAALSEEIDALSPKLTIFATSEAYRSEIHELLRKKGYVALDRQLSDGWTTIFSAPGAKLAIQTRHPQC
jgi:hypothetical protein